jgi:hypothetical protein
MRYLLTGLIAGLLLTGCSPEKGNDQSGTALEIRYELRLTDPVKPELGPQPCEIIQTVDTNGFPQNYRMKLFSEVCLDRSCKVLEATLYWDALGRFLEIEHPPGKPFTKADHIEFTEADYAKLNSILKDTGSLLGTCPISSFSGKKDAQKDADGISGATAASIQSSVIKGAGYSSWVLWRWVNGAAHEQLIALTRKSSPPGFILHCLTGGDPAMIQYALETLSLNGVPPQSNLTAAVLSVLKSSDHTNSRQALEYLKKAIPDAEVRNYRLAEIAGQTDEITSRQIIETLDAEPELSARVMETLAAQLNHMSYFQVHIILTIFENRHLKSETATHHIAGLVAADNAFIARRAKEYLSRME